MKKKVFLYLILILLFAMLVLAQGDTYNRMSKAQDNCILLGNKYMTYEGFYVLNYCVVTNIYELAQYDAQNGIK